MPFSDYSELQSTLADWLNRTDLASQIPDFITLAEAEIGRLVRRSTVRGNMTLTNPAEPLPATVQELRSLRLITASAAFNGPIEIVTPEVLAERRQAYPGAGKPRWASIVNAELLLVPYPDEVLTAEYIGYQVLDPLATAASGTNSVLAEAPDIYLYGSLVESAPYLEHDERIPVWQARFDRAIAGLNLKRENEEYGASLRPARLPVVF